MDPWTLAAVAIAGAAGAVLRHAANLLLQSAWPGLPLAIALVNVVGCLGFGVCWSLAQGRWSPVVATAVLAGFFGAFTTFSSFAFDCHELFAERRLWLWAANVLGQNVLGLSAMAAGIAAGRAFGRA
ncbi:MAG: CrcB family protein [Planctomycetota bacterium]